ncbi:hypothetical protein NDU88_006744 [Pleurodeles waltl]|uniref:Uncharacterized protein n=1 Tax=Pleurodeles waltl TaxID=8319 RepID=A0AAV7SQJ8_PLEWA|nr:hypothetical protein NDU88_006744 [Pleurodeles waltl]
MRISALTSDRGQPDLPSGPREPSVLVLWSEGGLPCRVLWIRYKYSALRSLPALTGRSAATPLGSARLGCMDAQHGFDPKRLSIDAL